MTFSDIYARDVAFAHREVGKKLVYGAYSTFGTSVLEPTEVLGMGEKGLGVQGNVLTVLIVTGSLGVLKNHTPITMDGTAYTIDRFIPLGNGLDTKLWLTGTGA